MIGFRTPAGEVQLSRDECRQLYILLGDSAPFVRNQVGVIRNGGGHSSISLQTADERQAVRTAIASADGEAVGPGLRALEAALVEPA